MSEKRKKDYSLASVEILRFNEGDVITTSSTYQPTPGGGMNDDLWDTE